MYKSLFLMFFVGALFVSTATPVSAASAPIGFWRFENSATSTLENSGTGSITGSLLNAAAPFSSAGNIGSFSMTGNAVTLDGVNDVITMGNPSVLNNLFAQDVTISAWIKPTSCNAIRYLGGKTNGGPVGVYLYSSNGSCNPRIDVHHSQTRATYIAAANSIIPNEWNHLTFVWNATAKSAKIYVNGSEVSYSYQNPGVGTYTSDALAHLIFGNWHPSVGTFFAGGMDEIKIYNYARTPTQILLDKNNITPTLEPVMVVRDATSYRARIQVKDAPEGTYAEYILKKVAKGVWNIQGLRIVDATDQVASRWLANTASVWEYAGFLGAAGDPFSATNWQDFGSGHGDENPTSFSLTLDGVDITSLPSGAYKGGSVLAFEQTMDTLYPKNNALIIGSSTLAHIFDEDGLTVDQSHTYQPGYEIYNFYTAMLPTTGALDGSGMNRVQIGTSTPRTISYGGSVTDLNTIADSATAYSTDHPYAIKMTLPFGGPDVEGDWSRDLGAEKMWLYDTTSGYAKVYTNWISGGYAARIPAEASQHQTHYNVYLRQ